MRFTAIPLSIPDVLLLRTDRAMDARGYFTETYRADAFLDLGIRTSFVQDNQAMSIESGTVRGLHFQAPPHAQAKLIRVLSGAIFDVAVDIRAGSATFGRWTGVRLSDASEQLFVPAGFAHGYCTLEPNTVVAYKCDAYYQRDAEGGVLHADPAIGIQWPVPTAAAVVAERDLRLPLLADLKTPFSMAAG